MIERQRHRVDLTCGLSVAEEARGSVALHCTRQALQNGFAESFIGRLRDEGLDEHMFVSLSAVAGSSKLGGSTATPRAHTRA
jgi:hypothetical protein